MSPPEYADAALEYVQAKGWTTNITELQEGAYLIGGARETDSGSEDMLLMVICEAMTQLEAKHLKYLINTGREKNVDAAKVTYTVEITEDAKEIGKSYNIGVIDSEKIRSYSEGSEFDVGADDISLPDPDSDTQESSSHASNSKEEGEEAKGLDEETGGQAFEAESREESASEIEHSSTAGEISEDQVDTQDTQSSYSDSEEQNKVKTENHPPTKEIKANYSQSNGRSVGGKLTLGDKYLHFKPHSLDELLSGDEVEIFYTEVVNVGTKDRFSGGLKDTLFGGGLRKRLKIETQEGDEFLFVVSNLGDIVDDVEGRVQEIKTTEKTADTDRIESSDAREGSSTDQDVDGQGKDESNHANEGQPTEQNTDHNDVESGSKEWNPNFPILSVFVSIMVLRLATVFANSSSNPVGVLVTFVLGILIIPRVRKQVDNSVQSLTGWSLKNRFIQAVIGLIYLMLAIASIMVLITQFLGQPGMPGGIGSLFVGFLAVILAFMASVIIVYTIRFVRRRN